MNEHLTKEQIKLKYGQDILAWYHHIKRDLPWRQNHDPYRIWVSEIMLQQTRVDTVIGYYTAFMEKFPTVDKLATAPEEEVLKSWEGLGYYSRARNLQAGARMVMELYNGIIPQDRTAVAGLKGVGPYTCGAIMSIAFNESIPAVDGNVMRVISRFFCLEDDIAKSSTRIGIEKIVDTMIPEGEARYFNQALMELGALICTPKSPSCLICPVMEHCEARIQGRELQLPIKAKAKKARIEHRVSVIVEGTGVNTGKVLVRQRPAKGLLADMWELPHTLLTEEQQNILVNEEKEHPELGRVITELVQQDHHILIKPYAWFSDEEHLFSHIHWKMRFFLAEQDTHNNQQASKLIATGVIQNNHIELAAIEDSSITGYISSVAETAMIYDENSLTSVLTQHKLSEDEMASQEVYRFIGKEDMAQLPFPNLFLKVLEQYWLKKEEINNEK